MNGADLEARLLSAGIAATVTIAEHRHPHELEDGAFDTLTLHLPDGSISIEAVGENAYDVWLEAGNAPTTEATQCCSRTQPHRARDLPLSLAAGTHWFSAAGAGDGHVAALPQATVIEAMRGLGQ